VVQVRRESEPLDGGEHILALNKHGVHFLDLLTHETILHYPYTEVRYMCTVCVLCTVQYSALVDLRWSDCEPLSASF